MAKNNKTRWCLVTPINHYFRESKKLLKEGFNFGYGVKISKIPLWLPQKNFLQYFSHNQKNNIKSSVICFKKNYKALSLGDPDPKWKGQRSRSIQSTSLEAIKICNLALWICKPTSLNFSSLIHAQNSQGWIHRKSGAMQPFLPHNKQSNSKLTMIDLNKSKVIFKKIMKLKREGSLWVTLRNLETALSCHPNWWIPRYLLLWLCLEALFGADTEITHQISERISFFIGKTKSEKQKIYKKSKKAYQWRSKIIHGRDLKKLTSALSSQLMETSELFLRKSLMNIFENSRILSKFQKNNEIREEFLRKLVFN